MKRAAREEGVKLNDPLAGITPNHLDEAHEARLSELRGALLTHPAFIRRMKLLARMRIPARERSPRVVLGGPLAGCVMFDSPAWHDYGRALADTAHRINGTGEAFIEVSELDNFARVWWSRRRDGSWGRAYAVGGRPRYGRTGQRRRSVTPETVRLAVEAIARRLEDGYKLPEADALRRDPSAPRQARRKLQALL